MTAPLAPIPLGVSDFRMLRERGYAYVDKTHLLQELLDREGAQVILLPRPRRFGKTLNISMLRSFLEKRPEDLSHLFEGLSVWNAGDRYRAHFQRYPVIHMTFKDIKFEDWERCRESLKERIVSAYDAHREVLESGRLSEVEARRFRQIMDGTASQALYDMALAELSRYLHDYHRERVVILIDEYDEPIHAAHMHGYSAQVIEFFRAFFTGGLKDNPHLARAVLTGVLRIPRESIFSGLNNVVVHSLLRSEYNTCFGFTEAEVMPLLERAGRRDQMDAVRAWYDGYVFGGENMYNPWSILNFIASQEPILRGYWVATSSNDLIRDTLQLHALAFGAEMEVLLEGGAIERRLDENVVLSDLQKSPAALFSLLVFSGYLKASAGAGAPGEEPSYLLSIPNREVRQVYTTTFQGWLEARLGAHGRGVEQLSRALLGGDAEALEEQMQRLVTDLLSYHDIGGVDPERVYQAFVVGLLAAIEPAYQVRSNRESGQGRPDVMIRPAQAGKPGVVLELKIARPPRKTLDAALAEGLAQLQRQDYAAKLRASGATPVHAFAIAFDGKIVRVRAITAG